MASAEGKHTVLRRSSQPSTSNRKIGDLWFKTNEGNKMFVWTGSWTETKLDHQALSVGKLSAISADLGDVTLGHMTGVTMNLANGKFVVDEHGNVTFKGHLEGASGTFSGKLEGAWIDSGGVELIGDVVDEKYHGQLSNTGLSFSYIDEYPETETRYLHDSIYYRHLYAGSYKNDY